MFVSGSYVSYTRHGEGKPLLLLHGYNSSKESFFYQNSLSGFDIIIPDMPHFGKTPSTSPMSLDDYYLWLREFLKKLGVDRTHIIAHSFGARVAIMLAAKSPEMVDKLIIVGGAGLKKDSKKKDRKIAMYRRVRRFFPKFAERHFGSKEYRALDQIKRDSYKKIVNYDLKETAKKILSPTLLVYGEDDTTTPYSEEGETFHRLICGSQLIKMQGGHFCFVDYHNEFNQIIKKFLE